MSEKKKIKPNNFQPSIYIKYRGFSLLKDNLKQYRKLSPYSTSEINKAMAIASNEETTKEVLKGTTEIVKNQRSRKKRWLSFAFLMLNLVILTIILWYQFSHMDDNISLPDLFFSELNWWWILGALGLFFMAQVFDAFRIWILIKHSTGQNRPCLSFKSIVTQHFYDCITPMATGGQPFQIFYLNKRGLSAGTATSVPLAKFIFGQAVFIVFALIVIVANTTDIIALNVSPVIITLSWIGLGLNTLLIFAIVMLSVSKRVVPSILVGILKLCKKLHFIKDYRRTYAKVMHMIREYITVSRKFFSNPFVTIGELIASLGYSISYYTVPFCIFCAMCGSGADVVTWAQVMALFIAVDLASGFMPLPGGSGAAELSSKAVFLCLFAAAGAVTGLSVWAMLFWRIFTYYGFLLEGVLLMFYDYAIGNRKIEKTLQKLQSKKH